VVRPTFVAGELVAEPNVPVTILFRMFFIMQGWGVYPQKVKAKTD